MDPDAKEILVGDTNRKESESALAKLKESGHEHAYTVEATDNKIVIVGLSDGDTVIGVKNFINRYILGGSESVISIKSGDSYTNKTGELIYSDTNLEHLVVLEKLNDIYCPESKKSNSWADYGKIIKLEHSEKYSGTLLATHEQRSDHYTDAQLRYPIFRSSDGGESWERIAYVSDTKNNNDHYTGWQPNLFELPCDIGDFKKGTVLLGGCTRKRNMSQTIIALHYSTDGGESWQTHNNIDVGSGYHSDPTKSNGIYEPFFIFEEETKRLYCFYSDETDPKCSQKLVFKYTTDLKTWSAKKDAVAGKTFAQRPGMPVLTKMGNGKYALVFEVGGNVGGGYPIYMKTTDHLDNWGDVSDFGKLIATPDGNKNLASAPAAIWTPSGGEKGTLFITSSWMPKGSTTTKCDLFMSFDYGESFVATTNPIPTKYNSSVLNGYSPGFYVDKEGTLFYVNNPEAYDKALYEKLMFAEIKIY